jgi:hypothetical protein
VQGGILKITLGVAHGDIVHESFAHKLLKKSVKP